VLCRLYVQWRFLRGIEAQFLALQKGFNELIPQHLLRPFDERELEVRVYGLFAFSMEHMCVSKNVCGSLSFVQCDILLQHTIHASDSTQKVKVCMQSVHPHI